MGKDIILIIGLLIIIFITLKMYRKERTKFKKLIEQRRANLKNKIKESERDNK